jgi:hypothetical protein
VYLDRPHHLIEFSACTNVLVRDVTLKDAPLWTVHVADSRDVTILGIRIRNNPRIGNNDGVHCTTSRNIHIANCEIAAGDDALCVTSVGSRTPGVCENVTVTNCTLSSRSAAVRLGYGNNTVRNCVFQNLVIRESNRGIGLFVRDRGSIENVLFSDICIQTRLHTGHWWGNGEPIHVSAISQSEETRLGVIRQVTFANIVAASESGIVVYSDQPGCIQEIAFRDVCLDIKNSPLNASYGGNFDLRPAHDKQFAIFSHDVPAVYGRGVTGLTIENVAVTWADGLPDFFTHGIWCEEFSDVVIDGFRGRQARRGSDAAVIALRRGRTVTIRNCRAEASAATFLTIDAVNDTRLFVNNDLSHARRAMHPEPGGFTISGNLLPKL